MKNSAIIKKDKLGIVVETTKTFDGKDFTLVTIQKAKSFGEGMYEVTVSLENLRTILAKAEELK